MGIFFSIIGLVVAVWVIYIFFYNKKLKYLQHGLTSRLHTASNLILQGADIVNELKKNSIHCNIDEKEKTIIWHYHSFPDWYFIYFLKSDMITVNCTLLNKKYNMITLWAHFKNKNIQMTWSINKYDFAGQLNQDAILFIQNLHKYGVYEYKAMNG